MLRGELIESKNSNLKLFDESFSSLDKITFTTLLFYSEQGTAIKNTTNQKLFLSLIKFF